VVKILSALLQRLLSTDAAAPPPTDIPSGASVVSQFTRACATAASQNAFPNDKRVACCMLLSQALTGGLAPSDVAIGACSIICRLTHAGLGRLVGTAASGASGQTAGSCRTEILQHAVQLLMRCVAAQREASFAAFGSQLELSSVPELNAVATMYDRRGDFPWHVTHGLIRSVA
jgi:hypothetical protein